MRGRLRIMASTFQMGVLLHFDTVGKDVVSFGDLRGATLLEEKDLKIAILSLLKVKFMKVLDFSFSLFFLYFFIYYY